jgi:alkylation response protein AidB-like acyl-CoA dehydrogenase
MDLLPDEEQQAIIDQTAGFLEGELPLGRFHALGGQPEQLSQEIWKKMAELGWFGLGLPEAQGGVGFTLAEESLLVRELGRVLAPPTLVATLLGVRCAALCNEDALRDAGLAGEIRVAWAQCREHESPGLGRGVSGRFHVFDPGGATHLLLLDASGARLVEAQGLAEARALECLDERVGLAELELDGASVLAFLEEGVDSIRARAFLLVSALLVGQCEATRDDAVAYAKERVQFGKPIGVFQAVKHPCADMAVGCEAALSQLLMASLVVRDGLPGGLFQATAAKLVAARTAVKSAERNVQIHGGYGFTTEYDAHLFVKRAHLLDVLAASQPVLTQVLLDEKPLN